MNTSVAGGRLYVVSTPIGNLGDFSFRAIDVLRGVAVVLAEDTRHSRVLLDRYEIRTPVASYHEHNEAKMTPRLIARLRSGDDLALISDAGTPLLSDPGARLVAAAIDAAIAVTPIPGASALLSALVASGISADRFTFYGFLPRRGQERASILAELASLTHTAVLYEAPTRLANTLGELEVHGAGQKKVAVAREMTKQYEEVRRGTVSTLHAYYSEATPKGEVVIVLAGAEVRHAEESDVRARARALASGGLSAREVVAQLVAELGVPRNRAYAIVEEEKPHA